MILFELKVWHRNLASKYQFWVQKQGGFVNGVLPNFAKFPIGGYIKYCQFYGLRLAILKKIWNDFSEKYLELHLKARFSCHKLTRMLIY